MNESILYILIALVVAILFIGPIVIAVLLLRKLDRAASERKAVYGKAKFRFFIVDFFSLIFLLQLPIGFAGSDLWGSGIEVAILFLSVALTAVWWTTIRTVSEAGIATVKWRALISMIVIPATFIGSFYLGIAAVNFANGASSTRSVVWMVLAFVSLAFSPLIVNKALASAESLELTLTSTIIEHDETI